MINVRDSFLHFLSDNLTTTTVNGATVNILVHNTRRDINVVGSDSNQIDAINVKFLNADFAMEVSTLTASIDVIYSDELQCAAVTEALFTLLRQAAYTPKLDYSDLDNPVDVGYTVFWEPAIKFKPIQNMLYTHYHARLILNHYQQP